MSIARFFQAQAAYLLWPLILMTLLLACRSDEAAMDLNDAYSEIGAAINFKAQECGTMPAYPLILPGKPTEYGVRLCGLLILGESCPFQNYPLFCLEIYSEQCDFCDVPGLDP
ncbi:MAG: hypothetical protein NXI24_15620 [bacterium]|nr:hypothetical protein [bacterium]